MGSMYASVLFLGVQSGVSVQPAAAAEKTVFYREGAIKGAAGMYSALPYAFGQVMIKVPYCFIQALIYLSLMYFTFYSVMGVAVTPNYNIASLVSSAFYLLWNLFPGFIIPKTKLQPRNTDASDSNDNATTPTERKTTEREGSLSTDPEDNGPNKTA